MPGVFRPYTLVDVLGTLNQQTTGQDTSQTVTGLGYFGETDETTTFADSWTSTLQTPATWDNGTWGAFTWA